MTTAAIYARLSSRDRKDGSKIEQQVKECRTYAKDTGLKVVAEYLDDGVSGSKISRPGLNGAIAEAENGKFDALIVRSHTRLARNSTVTGLLQAQLESAGVAIHYVQLGGTVDRESSAGVWTDGIMKLKAEAERVDIRRRTMDGRYRRAKEGKIIIGGITVFGYRRVRKNVNKPKEAYTALEVVPGEAKIVRLIFKWFLKGESYAEIADALNKRKVKRYNAQYRSAPVRKGKVSPDRWTGYQIKALLSDVQYIGIRYYGVQKSKMLPVDDKVKRWFVDPSDKSVVKQKIKPIINKAAFDQAQAQIKTLNRKNARKKPSAEFLLRSRIECAKCGGVYYCKTYTKPNKKKLYRYRHTEASQFAECLNKPVMLYRDPVDKMIRSELDARSKLTNKQIEQMADDILNSIPDERKERIEYNEEIDSKITELENEEAAERKLVVKGVIRDEDYMVDRDRRLEEISELEATRFDVDELAGREELVKNEKALRKYLRWSVANNRTLDYFALVDRQDITLEVLGASDNDLRGKIKLFNSGVEIKRVDGK